MSLQQRSRGRPKGSGINDRQRLRDIATLIATQPQIKPTTAIKMLGEHDPSVIRRLRDKFYSLQQELMDEIRSGCPPSPVAGSLLGALPAAAGHGNAGIVSQLLRSPSGDSSARANTGSIGIGMMPRIGDGAHSRSPAAGPVGAAASTDVQPTAVSGTTIPAPAPLVEQATQPVAHDVEKAKLMDLAAYNVMLSLAIQATVSALAHQTRVYDETPRLPPITALLRQQIAIGEMVMSVTWPHSPHRSDGRIDTAQPVAG